MILKNSKYPLDTCDCIIDVKLTPKGYLAQTLSSLSAVIYITLQDKIKRIIAILKPHDATIKGSDSIPAPIVVPIIKKTEPIDLEFIYQLYFFVKRYE